MRADAIRPRQLRRRVVKNSYEDADIAFGVWDKNSRCNIEPRNCVLLTSKLITHTHVRSTG